MDVLKGACLRFNSVRWNVVIDQFAALYVGLPVYKYAKKKKKKKKLYFGNML